MQQTIASWYDRHEARVMALAKDIWEHPEIMFEEFRACKGIGDFLEENGFTVQRYNCKRKGETPNTLAASWGKGGPVIAVIGEYDALQGMGQDAVPHESPREGVGHGCGHNLISPACASAVVALKAAMEAEHIPGTLKFLGCPAEEGGAGKILMMRDGIFDGVDCVMFWHPMNFDIRPYEAVLQAITCMSFEFFGKAAHAAVSPELGRSALDAAELMNTGVQYLREHVTPDVRIHYSYAAAGEKPNIVPAYAKVDYYIRAKDMHANAEAVERVKKVAEGAAIMTETTWKATVDHACSETVIVHSFNNVLYEALKKVPPLQYTEEELAFAKALYENANGKPAGEDFMPMGIGEITGKDIPSLGSTDAGYVTYNFPTSRLFGLGVPRGIPAHHWGTTAAAGSPLGLKAAIFAGKALAQAGYDVLKNPDMIETFKAELMAARGGREFTPVWPDE